METVANHPIPTFVHVLVVFLALAVRKLFSVRFFSHVKTTELASKNQMDILVNVKMVTMAIIVKILDIAQTTILQILLTVFVLLDMMEAGASLVFFFSFSLFLFFDWIFN